MSTTLKPKFNPGKLVATPAFTKKVGPQYGMAALCRHLEGNWGLCDDEDWHTNNEALKHGGRLLSSWPLPDEAGDFWILTEADRSVTTMLLPSDY
jgi:hypothetical protein